MAALIYLVLILLHFDIFRSCESRNVCYVAILLSHKLSNFSAADDVHSEIYLFSIYSASLTIEIPPQCGGWGSVARKLLNVLASWPHMGQNSIG